MKYIRAFLMSMTMFCAIPVPYKKWDDESRPLMTVMLPFVGLVIGLVWYAIAMVCDLLNFPPVVKAVFLCMAPYVLSGYMHLDGFMDVTDAVKSCRDLPERRRILKDPTVGSFATIGVVLLIVLSFAMFASADLNANYTVLIFIPVVSRICSSFFVSSLPPMETSQFSGEYRKGVHPEHIWAFLGMLMVTIVAAVIICRWYALVIPFVILGYSISLSYAYNSLQGMNGDIAGYALTLGELTGIMCLALMDWQYLFQFV